MRRLPPAAGTKPGKIPIEQSPAYPYCGLRLCVARVAQLDRASVSEAEGYGFDPRHAHHSAPPLSRPLENIFQPRNLTAALLKNPETRRERLPIVGQDKNGDEDQCEEHPCQHHAEIGHPAQVGQRGDRAEVERARRHFGKLEVGSGA